MCVRRSAASAPQGRDGQPPPRGAAWVSRQPGRVSEELPEDACGLSVATTQEIESKVNFAPVCYRQVRNIAFDYKLRRRASPGAV